MNIPLIEKLRRTYLFDSIDLHFASFIYSKENKAVREITPFFAAIVSFMLNKGHICINLKDFFNQLLINEDVNESESIRIPDGNEWEKSITVSDTIGKTHENKPLLYDRNYLYLNKFYHYELNVFQKIIELCSSKETFKLNHELLNYMFNNPADINQKDACCIALQNKFSVISGGPGTGKTTIIAKMLYLFLYKTQNLKIALATPTGKASARMNEAISISLQNIKDNILNNCPEFLKDEIINKIYKIEAKTIHRLLGTFSSASEFEHNKDNLLPHDIIIIDEASMIDIVLISKLFDAIKPCARIILIGDKNQLSSVEAGSFFSDICEAAEDKACFTNKNVIVLYKSYRHAESEGIIELSEFVNSFNSSNPSGCEILDEFMQNYPQNIKFNKIISGFNLKKTIKNFIISGFKEYISASDYYEMLVKFNNLRILCAIKKGTYGVYNLNEMVQEILSEEKLINSDNEFYDFRPIMITINDYNLNLFNGDIGIIRNGRAIFFLPEKGKVREIIPFLLPQHETAFAITIHKSQGSEFENVLMILPDTENQILTKELLYTGITRSKKHINIITDEKIFLKAISTGTKRTSTLKEKIKNYHIAQLF